MQQKPISEEAERTAKAALDRWQRISMNDIENVYPALIVIWATLFTGFLASFRNGFNVEAFMALTTLFTLSRVGHTLVYKLQLSKVRSAMWFIGHIAVFGLLVQMIYMTFTI